MIKRGAVVAQRDLPTLPEGLRAVMIAATGSASNPPFAAVFQPQNPIPLTRHLLDEYCKNQFVERDRPFPGL
jgi:hypothetical protein